MSTHTHTGIKGMLCLFVSLFLCTGITFSQNSSVPATTVQSTPLELFNLNNSGNLAKDYVTDATFLTLDRSKLRRLLQNRPQNLTLQLPTQSGKILEIALQQQQVLTESFTVHTSDATPVLYEPGLYYKGAADKSGKSSAAISFFPDMVMGVLTIDDHHYVLGHLNQNKYPAGDNYILYDETTLRIQNTADCAADDLPSFHDFISPEDLVGDPQASPMGECQIVPIYFECDYKMYQDRGSSTTNVMNFLTGFFNVVTTLYQNEGINVRISDTKIWNTPDPYPYSSSSAALNTFRSRLNGSFDGALAHLLSTRSAGNGGIAYVDVICAPAYAVAYSNINNTYSNFPTYSWTVNVVAHEMGHNLGSPHTHSCSWPGGALDNCFTPEGACGRGPAPSNGGTVMSYCHLTSNGVNFNNGFGEQPGNLIRNRVSAASCLPTIEGNCEGGGGSGSPNLTKFSDNLEVSGQTIQINLRVRNQGDGNARASRVGFYLSEDSNFSSADHLIETKNIDPVDAEETTNTINFEISIDDITGLSEGSYYLGYTIDYLNEVIETNENDNTWYWPSPQIEIGGDPLSYCDAEGRDVTYEWIANVRFGTINNSTGRDGGYGDYTNLSTDIPIGGTTQLNLTPGHSNQPYAEQWRVWIDLNRDGDFEDADELVFSSPVATTDPVNTSISIPGSASPGNTRMRVSMKWLEEDNQLQGPCSSFGFGEIEDYTIKLTGEGGGGGEEECFINGVSTAERFDCDATTNTYTQRLNLNYTGSPEVIKIQAGNQNYSFNATGSPQLVELTGLEATGNAVDVTVTLNSEDGCSDNRTFFALFIAARPCEPDECEVPLLLGAEQLNGNRARIQWDAVPGARFYQFRYRQAGDPDWITRTVESGTSYDIMGVGNNTTIEYQVRAECNTVGWSEWTEMHIFKTTGDCATPDPYGVEIQSATSVVIHWYAVAGAQKYRIRYRVAGTSAWTGDVEVTGVTFLSLNNLQVGEAYEYQLRTRCSDGWSGWSAIFMFMPTQGLAPLTGHQLVSNDNIAVQIGPNPSRNFINVKVPSQPMKMILISDMNGRPMKQLYVPTNNSTIDVTHLPQGMYILDIILEQGQRVTKRFVKNG